MTLSPNLLAVCARWLHLQHYGPIAANRYRDERRCPRCDENIRKCVAGEGFEIFRASHGLVDPAEAVRWDGPAYRAEAERVLNARLPREDGATVTDDKGRTYVDDKIYRVASVLWTASLPHTAEDSWMALLDDGRVGMVARLPKVVQQLRCRACEGGGVVTLKGRQSNHLRFSCSGCHGKGKRTEYVNPRPARIVGLFPDFSSAAASLPDCYWVGEAGTEALRRAQRQWDGRVGNKKQGSATP